jgi:hypothetical protein
MNFHAIKKTATPKRSVAVVTKHAVVSRERVKGRL